MTAYTTLTDATLTANKPIKQSIARAWRDNPIAITEGSAGAPKIQTAALEQTASSEAVTTATIRALAVTEAKLAANSVAQGKLKTASASQTVSVASGGGAEPLVTFTGGDYMYQWRLGDGDATLGNFITAISGNAAATPVGNGVRLVNLSGTTLTAYITEFYFSASGPYDLGEGEIPIFVFALLSSDGKVLRTSSAKDPPWAYNGPTRIVPDVWISGRPYSIRHKRTAHSIERGDIETLRSMARARKGGCDCLIESTQRHALLAQEAATLSTSTAEGFLSLQENERLVRCHEELAAIERELARETAESEFELVEVTQAVKNADMSLIPHPFLDENGSSPEGTIVLLDPRSEFVEELRYRHDDGEAISHLIRDGHVVVDTSAIQRAGPPGVMCVGAKWKRTR